MLIPTTVLTNTGGSASFVGVRAVRSTAQVIGASSFTAAQLNAADTFDTDGFHDPASSNTKIIIPSGRGGYYRFNGEIAFELNTTGTRGGLILLNSTTALGTTLTPPGPGFGTTLHVDGLYNLAVADFVELHAFQSTAGNLNMDNAWFSAQYLGA
jgi:hypothetical protein